MTTSVPLESEMTPSSAYFRNHFRIVSRSVRHKRGTCTLLVKITEREIIEMKVVEGAGYLTTIRAFFKAHRGPGLRRTGCCMVLSLKGVHRGCKRGRGDVASLGFHSDADGSPRYERYRRAKTTSCARRCITLTGSGGISRGFQLFVSAA